MSGNMSMERQDTKRDICRFIAGLCIVIMSSTGMLCAGVVLFAPEWVWAMRASAGIYLWAALCLLAAELIKHLKWEA